MFVALRHRDIGERSGFGNTVIRMVVVGTKRGCGPLVRPNRAVKFYGGQNDDFKQQILVFCAQQIINY